MYVSWSLTSRWHRRQACPSCIAIIHTGNSESTIFRFCFLRFIFVYIIIIKCSMLFFNIQLCKILTCEIPEVTLCGWRGYKPSINKQTLLQLEQALRMIGWLAIFHRRRFSVWSIPGGAECMDLTQAAGGHMLLTLWTLDSDPCLIPWYAVTMQWNEPVTMKCCRFQRNGPAFQ